MVNPPPFSSRVCDDLMLSPEIARSLLIGIARLRDELVRSVEPSQERAAMPDPVGIFESHRPPSESSFLTPPAKTASSYWYYAVEDLFTPKVRDNPSAGPSRLAMKSSGRSSVI